MSVERSEKLNFLCFVQTFIKMSSDQLVFWVFFLFEKNFKNIKN